MFGSVHREEDAHMSCTAYGSGDILQPDRWLVEMADEFEPELAALAEAVQDELLARLLFLRQFGPELGRPHVDTLKGSRHPNMKELRFAAAGGAWRVAFAFDSRRRAILLVAGNKAGLAERLFYRRLLRKADDRFDSHLARIGARK
jgi:hypothetical protein